MLGSIIPWIFEREGEEGFRRALKLTQLSAIVQSGPQVTCVFASRCGSRDARRKTRTLFETNAIVVIYMSSACFPQLYRTSRKQPLALFLQTGDPQSDIWKKSLFESTCPLLQKTVGDLDHMGNRLLAILGLSRQ